jgi:hypothetical protein
VLPLAHRNGSHTWRSRHFHKKPLRLGNHASEWLWREAQTGRSARVAKRVNLWLGLSTLFALSRQLIVEVDGALAMHREVLIRSDNTGWLAAPMPRG